MPRPPGPAPEPGASSASGYRAVLRDRRYLLFVAIRVNFVFTALVLSLLFAAYITTGLHRQAWIAAALLVFNGAQAALTQTSVTRWLQRFPPVRVIGGSALLNALAFGLFAAVGAAPAWLVLAGLSVGMLLYNFAETAAAPFTEELSVSLAPEHMRGRYLAVCQLAWTFGQTAAPAVFTLLLTEGAAWPWVFLIALNLAAVPALLLLERRIGVRPADRYSGSRSGRLASTWSPEDSPRSRRPTQGSR